MWILASAQCQWLQQKGERKAKVSVFSFLWETVDAEVGGRAEISLAFHICLLHHGALPAYNERCSVERCSSFFPASGRRLKKQTNPNSWAFLVLVPDGWQLYAGLVLLSIPVCRSSWYRLLERHKETSRKRFLLLNKQGKRLKTPLLRFWHLFSKERRLFLLHRASYSCFAMKESRTQLLPLLLPSVGLCACCWHRRNLSIMRQLFCEHWFMAGGKDGF